jgi:Uma2 family endonuclease
VAAIEPESRRWTVEEFHRLAETGVFGPEERLELIDGDIVCMSPQNPPHSTAAVLTEAELARVFRRGYHLRGQKPLVLGTAAEPEPDIAVVRGSARDFRRQHPTTAALVVEVADSSLDYDRGPKAALYARAGIPEYWILNVPERVLEVHRDPDAGAGVYRSTDRLGESQAISPLAAPSAVIRISDLLP